MPWKCLVITSVGRLNHNYGYTLLLWGIILVSTSRYSVKVRRMLNLSALTCKLASQSCLRIHLDCLTAIKSNLFGSQDCLKICRGGHQGELIHFLGVQQCDCLENLPFPLLALVGDQAPRKDHGTNFGCVYIQSNGLIALEVSAVAGDLWTHAVPCLFLGVGKGFLNNLLPKNC